MKGSKALTRTNALIRGFRHALAPLWGSERSLVGVVAVGLLLLVLSGIGWAKWGTMIGLRSWYIVSADSLEITPQPSWIQSDIKADVLRDGGLAGLSILDADLTRQVVRAFELNTWVAEVTWAGKRPGEAGPRILVRLRYREPVIMVRTRDPRWEGDCFWPVDTEGVFLPPQDFSANQTRNYLRVEAGNSLPAGAVGTAYGDAGVAGAARIATLLRDAWKPMGLEWIVVRREATHQLSGPVEPTYVLLPVGVPPEAASPSGPSSLSLVPLSTAGGLSVTEIRWGHAPGREPVGEVTAGEKIARLIAFVARNGPLHELAAGTVIDVRPEQAISVTTNGASTRQTSHR